MKTTSHHLAYLFMALAGTTAVSSFAKDQKERTPPRVGPETARQQIAESKQANVRAEDYLKELAAEFGRESRDEAWRRARKRT